MKNSHSFLIYYVKAVLFQRSLDKTFIFQVSFKQFFTLSALKSRTNRCRTEYNFVSLLLSNISIHILLNTFSAKDATFYIGRRPDLKDTFSFGLIHQGWYLTASDEVGSSWKTTAAFDNHTSEFALESSFIAVPYAMNDNPYKNCDTIGPQEPEQPEIPPGPPAQPPSIPGQPPPPSVPGTPAYPSGPPGSNQDNYFTLVMNDACSFVFFLTPTFPLLM